MQNWNCVSLQFQFYLKLDLGTPKLVCLKSVYRCRKQSVSTPTWINQDLASNEILSMDRDFTIELEFKTGSFFSWNLLEILILAQNKTLIIN